MKTRSTLFILLSLVFATGIVVFNACSKEEEELIPTLENPEFQLGQTDINALATAGAYTIAVTGNVKWVVAINPDAAAWCVIEPESGEGDGTITVTLKGNDTGKARRATIATKAAHIDEQQTVGLIQHSYAPFLTLSKDTVNVLFTASADTVTLFSTQDWKITKDNPADEWYTLAEGTTGTAGNGRLVINMETNTGETRKATITAHTPDVNKTITVIQQATTMQFDISPATFSPVPVGGDDALLVDITSNTSWRIESSATWCTPNPATGNNSQVAALTILPNTGDYSRKATITFTIEGLPEKTVEIIQSGTAADFVYVENKTITATPEFEKYQILVESSVAWTAAKDAADWYSITPASGINNGTVTVTMLGYHPTTTQNATITIAPKNQGQGEAHIITLNATYEGVEFNGVIWAPTDVDDPGTFTAAVGKPGKLYQFSKAIPWHVGISVSTPDWWGRDCNNPVNRGNTDWDEVNQGVCPEGWQMPSYAQLNDLLNGGTIPVPIASQNGYGCFSVRNGLLYFTFGRTDCKYNYPVADGPDYSYASDNWGVWTKTSVSGAFAWEARGANGWYYLEGPNDGNKTRGHKVRCVKQQ